MKAAGRYKPYPAYKDSGVAWLGDVPEGWDITRLKRCGRLVGGAGFPPEEQGQPENELPFYKVGDLVSSSDGKHMQLPMNTVSSECAMSLRATIIPQASIIYAKIGAALTLNRRRITSTSCCIDNNMTAFLPFQGRITTAWSYYWLSIIDFNECVNPGAVPSFSEGDQSILLILCPPLPEQTAIAAFLDRETARLDALIAKKKRLIELLAEKRTAVISHAVTKGLDPAAPMKDSGVEWLGEVPAHWDVKRLKFLLRNPLQYGANESAELDDPDLPRYIRITDVAEDGSLKDETFRSLPEETAKPYLLKEGDVLLARSGATVGKSFIYKSSWGVAAYAGYLIRASCNEASYLADFMYFFTRTKAYWSYIKSALIQATIQNVSAEKYANLWLPVPPIQEQERIVSFLNDETAQIDGLITKNQAVIAKLQEYRTALITAAVTGKIDVRAEAPVHAGAPSPSPAPPAPPHQG